MIGIFQGSPEGRANECQRRAKGGLPRATSKKQGKSRAKEGHDRAPSQKQGSLAAMNYKVAINLLCSSKCYLASAEDIASSLPNN